MESSVRRYPSLMLWAAWLPDGAESRSASATHNLLNYSMAILQIFEVFSLMPTYILYTLSKI